MEFPTCIILKSPEIENSGFHIETTVNTIIINKSIIYTKLQEILFQKFDNYSRISRCLKLKVTL